MLNRREQIIGDVKRLGQREASFLQGVAAPHEDATSAAGVLAGEDITQ